MLKEKILHTSGLIVANTRTFKIRVDCCGEMVFPINVNLFALNILTYEFARMAFFSSSKDASVLVTRNMNSSDANSQARPLDHPKLKLSGQLRGQAEAKLGGRRFKRRPHIKVQENNYELRFCKDRRRM